MPINMDGSGAGSNKDSYNHKWSSLAKGNTIATNKWYNRGDKYTPKSITIHSMEGNDTAQKYAQKLKDSNNRISYNYCIGSDGTIWGSVPEEFGSISSNSKNHDLESINIVMAVVNDNGEVTQEAWNSLVRLAKDVSSRYGFTLEYTGDKSGTVTTHAMFFDDTDCPGSYLTGKLSQLADEANGKSSSDSSGNSSTSSSSTTSSSSGDALSKIPAGVINLEFSYGYNDGQMSEVHRGVMTEYDISFDPTGATLTIEGVSLEFVSFNDPNSVTYKGMTIEEIIRSIAKEEGWIIDDDSIEPIAEVKESVTYSLTTAAAASGGLTNVYDNGSGSSSTGSGGTITDGSMNATQQKLVNAANARTTGRAGWCAEWVSLVFQDAGLGYPGGNACDMYDKWCKSSDKSQLKPGMIIAIHPSPTSSYGHIGIYIGNNTVRHNAGGNVKNSTVDEWIKDYTPSNATNIAKWGWADNNDLSK